MSATNQDILHFTRFANMSKWSANASVFDGTKVTYPLVKLSKVLTRMKEPVAIQDDTLYKRVTVRLYGQGVLQRDQVIGKDIGTKRQFIAHAGQLIISRIDARNGAFGIVPEDLEGAIVTNDFWLFDVRDALPQYLMLVMSSELFQQYWQTQSSGTTNRQRVGEDDFLQSKIAIPSIEEQQALLTRYNNNMYQAKVADENAHNVGKRIDILFFDKLKVLTPDFADVSEKMLYTYKLSNLHRWDVWNYGTDYSSAKYSSIPFGRLTIGRPMYGANEKARKEPGNVRYIRITDINDDGTLKDNPISARHTDEKYLLKEGDFLLARSGSVGRAFLYHENMGKAIYAGYLVKYKLNSEIINSEYMLLYTQTKLFKTWVKNNQHISAQPNINGQEYLFAPIIVPPLYIQVEIVNEAKKIRIQEQAMLLKAENLRQRAKKEFEEAVFGGV